MLLTLRIYLLSVPLPIPRTPLYPPSTPCYPPTPRYLPCHPSLSPLSPIAIPPTPLYPPSNLPLAIPLLLLSILSYPSQSPLYSPPTPRWDWETLLPLLPRRDSDGWEGDTPLYPLLPLAIHPLFLSIPLLPLFIPLLTLLYPSHPLPLPLSLPSKTLCKCKVARERRDTRDVPLACFPAILSPVITPLMSGPVFLCSHKKAFMLNCTYIK